MSMEEVILRLPAAVYVRMRELIIAGGKSVATGEAGVHASSQLLLLMDQQIQEQQQALTEKSKVNGSAKAEEVYKT